MPKCYLIGVRLGMSWVGLTRASFGFLFSLTMSCLVSIVHGYDYGYEWKYMENGFIWMYFASLTYFGSSVLILIVILLCYAKESLARTIVLLEYWVKHHSDVLSLPHLRIPLWKWLLLFWPTAACLCLCIKISIFLRWNIRHCSLR